MHLSKFTYQLAVVINAKASISLDSAYVTNALSLAVDHSALVFI